MEAASLRDQLKQGPPSASGGGGVWAWLRSQVDLAQYRPQALPGAEVSHLTDRQGPYVILKNPEAKTYYRLGDRDYFLWERMDGTRTVKELVVAYFLEFKSFAFSRVASLVSGLKQNRLLVDQPANLFGQVYRELARRNPKTRLLGTLSTVMGRQFAIGGLDRLVTAAYRWGGRLFFTWPALILYILVSVAGLVCFFRVFRLGGYGVAQVAGSYVWGVVAIAVAYLLAILVHESAHAFTVKRYGREVRRGGFMFYAAMPGFFVDTTDIWMEGKRARLAVTWAGPYSGLILAGLASIGMAAWPSFVLNAVLFQFAFMTYILVFFNLNPLLELDGYYMLMDWLEMPGLRHKSFEFLRTGLSAKLRGLPPSAAKGIARVAARLKAFLSSFSREEGIFTVFGVLATAWTAYALYIAAHFYQTRISSAVRGLWSRQLSAGQTIFSVLVLLVSLIVVAGLAVGFWSMVRNLVRSAARKGLFRSWKLSAVLLVAALVLGLVPGFAGRSSWLPFISLVALATAAALMARNATVTSGSRLAPFFWLLAGLGLALFFKEGVSLAQMEGWLGGELAGRIAAYLGLAAALCLLGAGLVLTVGAGLKQLARWEQVVLAVGLAVGCALALLAAARLPGQLGPLDPRAWLAVAGPASSLWFLLALVPTLVSYGRTRMAPSWALLALAAAGLLVTQLLDLSPVLPYLLLAAAGLAFVRAYASIAFADVQRVDRAFGSAVRSLHAEWQAIAGDRPSRTVESTFNTYALAAGWRVQVAQGQVEHSLPDDLPLVQRGETLAAALTSLLDLMAGQVGEKLTVRALQRAYDDLPWDQREVASQAIFRHVRRAEVLGQDFQATQQSYRALLQRIPLFATMDGAELDLLCTQLRLEPVSPGRAIIRQGEPGDRFYIVHRGHVEVTQRDARGVSNVVDQLDRGDYFGELALLNDAPRNATCRATVPTELLSLSRSDFERLVKVRFELRSSVDRSIARVELLRRVPLFADLDAYQVQLIAAQMREESYEPGAAIIRQGDVGETFYVIESGRVETSVREEAGERVVAQRGPGEYVGEIALLMQVPRTATVRALTQVRVLALDRDAFDRLVVGHLYLSRGLEREASRRMMGLRQSSLSPVGDRA
jgi:putative peptide zinc metalloprotease protein